MAWHRTTVSSPVEEIVAEVMVEEGEEVKKGDLLAQLASRKEELEVERLDQLIAKAQFVYDATKALHEEKIESKETLLEKKSDLDQALNAREVALADVNDRKILAPVSGVVVYRLKDPGEAIERVGPLFEIIDVQRLKLLFFLPVKRLASLKEGENYEVSFPEFPKAGSLQAKLIFIDPEVDPRSGLFRARFELSNEEAKIRPGVRAKLTLPEES